MAAFSTLFAIATLITASNAGKYGDCGYIIEPNDGVYNDVLDAYPGFENLTLPTRAYTAYGHNGHCNYYYDYRYNNNAGRHISWQYQCSVSSDAVTVAIWPGQINQCSGPNHVTYTFNRTNKDVEYYCGTQDCTLTVNRYHNDGNESCDSTFPLNTYSIVNGQCEYASDLSEFSGGYDYYLSAFCYNTSSYTYGIYGDSMCAYGPGEYNNVENGTCPSENESAPNQIGSLRYFVDDCIGEPVSPTTTMPGTTELYEQCAWAKLGYLPMPWVIGKDYCQVIPFAGPSVQSGYLTCSGGEVVLNAFSTTNCSGSKQALTGESALGGATSYNCMGSAAYCDVVWMTYYEQFAGGDPSFNYTYDECVIDAVTQGTAAFAVPMDTCWMNSYTTGSNSFRCDANLSVTVDIYNDSYCGSYLASDLLVGLDIYNNATQVSCVAFWRDNGEDVCQEPTTTEEPATTQAYPECAWAKLAYLPMPWVIGRDYCQVVPFGPPYASGYLSCMGGDVYFNGFSSDNCTGYGDFVPGPQAFGGVTDYNCMGSADYCDIIWMTYYEETAMGDPGFNLTYEQCVWKAAEYGTARFAIPMDTCWNVSEYSASKSFTCDTSSSLTVDLYNDSSCGWEAYLGQDLLIGLDIYNNATSVSCVYAWRANGEDVCQQPTTTEATTTEMSFTTDGPSTTEMSTTEMMTTEMSTSETMMSTEMTMSTDMPDTDEPTEEPTMEPTTDPTMEPTTMQPTTKCDSDGYTLATECDGDECNECQAGDVSYTPGTDGVTCEMKLDEYCDCEVVWMMGDQKLNCDDVEEGCVILMVKMAFVTIIGSWLLM